MPGLMTMLRGGSAPTRTAMTPSPSDPPPAATPTQASQPQQPQQQGLQRQQQPPSDASGGGQPDQSSKMFEANVLNSIYNKATLPALLQSLKAGKDPVTALAQAASQVVLRVQQSAGQSGVKPPIEAVLRAGAVAISDIATLAAQNGGTKYSDDQIRQAFLKGVDFYRTALTRSGQLDPAEWQQKFAQMKQADRAGQLEKMYPGMRQGVQALQAQGQKVQKGAPNMQQPMPGEDEGAAETTTEGGQEEPVSQSQTGMVQNGPKSIPDQSGAFKRKGTRQKAKKGK